MINESHGLSAAYAQIHVVVSKFFLGVCCLKEKKQFCSNIYVPKGNNNSDNNSSFGVLKSGVCQRTHPAVQL